MTLSKPLDTKAFMSRFSLACEKGDEVQLDILANFERETNSLPPVEAVPLVEELLDNCSERIRVQLLGLVVKLDDNSLIRKVVNSQWANFSENDRSSWEDWFGTYLLIKAVNLGLIGIDEALDRSSYAQYHLGASLLDPQYRGEVVKRVAVSICKLLDLSEDYVFPDVEMNLESEHDMQRVYYSLHDKDPAANDLHGFFERFNESIEDFNKRQHELKESFDKFRKELTSAQAMIILERFRLKDFKALVEADKDIALKWYDQLMPLSGTKTRLAYNLIVSLAYSFMGCKEEEKGLALFRKVRFQAPVIHFTYGRAQVELDAMALWSAPENTALKTILVNRLDGALNDHALALEVLAAEWNGKSSLIEQYIRDKLSRAESSEITRGIMVAGFSDSDSFDDLVSRQYAESAGFIRQAYEAAKYAYERNRWARHWYKMMCDTVEATDFWRYSQLLTKIVDGRFEIWRNEVEEKGRPMLLFWPSISQKVSNRIKKWEQKRKDKLFGERAPMPIFVSEYREKLLNY